MLLFRFSASYSPRSSIENLHPLLAPTFLNHVRTLSNADSRALHLTPAPSHGNKSQGNSLEENMTFLKLVNLNNDIAAPHITYTRTF